jgi:DNA-binding transcriptional LysR family regulator
MLARGGRNLDLAALDLNLLRVFDAIVRHGNLTAAGEAIGLSQPAMSNALTRLRAHFDDTLFVRAGHGMRPTEYALLLAGPIRNALEMLEQTLRVQAKFDPSKAERIFHICTPDIGEMVFLPALLKAMRETAPGVAIRCAQYGIREMREMLVSGELDFVLGYVPELTTGVYQKMLFDEFYVCMVRADHPRIGAKLSLERFIAESHALVASPGTGHAFMKDLFARMKPPVKVQVEVRNFASMPFIIANSDLVITVPSRLGKLFQALLPIRLLTSPIDLPSFKVKLFWHERNHHDPANMWLRALIVSLYSDPDGKAYQPPVARTAAESSTP